MNAQGTDESYTSIIHRAKKESNLEQTKRDLEDGLRELPPIQETRVTNEEAEVRNCGAL